MTAPDLRTDLSALSDHEIMMNLWLTVIMAIDEMEIDPDLCQQELLGAAGNSTSATTTLAAIMRETETRIGIKQTGPGMFEFVRRM
ncbi:hypothetical protein OE699_01805 [Sedimentimonas flavescens]|uniref:Uncharacterized protein n=1 Tax=Sedimentimonas flavescens TaxID=2851012 RepID=A0ABT2ZVB4_9RHOB|nr:hypothetical protein [Sedimentimonas flavescens]MCV2877573.1 hypothetical protein [Sedimentimonas flavescens]